MLSVEDLWNVMLVDQEGAAHRVLVETEEGWRGSESGY